jgi:ABC-type Zn uptake system ZnuABC Zn-binding protein ZnuA
LVKTAVAEAIPKELRLKMAEHDHDHAHDGAGHHHHGEHDPHTWLGVPQAIKMVEQIRATLQKVDPANKEKYAERAQKFIDEINALHAYAKEKLAGKMNRQLVTMHESLGYFAKSFDLDIVGSIQPGPNVEPDQRSTAELAELCKKKDVRVIAIEPQYNVNTAESLQRELARKGVKVELVEIDPFETADPKELDANLYIKVMKRNIDNLAKSLP